MRPIEFRAWDKKAKVMVYPVVVYETQDHVGFSEETFRRCYDKDGWYEHLEMWEEWYYLFDDKIMQYTGLKDASGQKIFEGDIVKIKNDNRLFYLRWFDEMCFGFADIRSDYKNTFYPCYDDREEFPMDSEISIIGNICQNKKLLKEAQNG